MVKYFTNDIDFLKQSQSVIQNIDYIPQDDDNCIDCDKFLTFWKDCKTR
jgi:hypothetical protein